MINQTVLCLFKLFRGGLPSWRSGVPVSNFTVKWMKWFLLNFHDRSAITQVLEHFWMLRLTHWYRVYFFYFLHPCLLAISWNSVGLDIQDTFRIWTQRAIGFTVYAWLECFIRPKLSARRFALSDYFLFSMCIVRISTIVNGSYYFDWYYYQRNSVIYFSLLLTALTPKSWLFPGGACWCQL